MGLVWALRDGAGAVVAVLVAAAVASALSVLTALVPVDVAVLSSTVFAVAFVSALPVSPFVASACACCSADARGCMASAMAGIGIVAPTMDVHAIAQSR